MQKYPYSVDESMRYRVLERLSTQQAEIPGVIVIVYQCGATGIKLLPCIPLRSHSETDEF
jgi:hypothetical protein